MRKLRVLVLADEDLVPPEDVEGLSEQEMAPFQMEYDVITTLRKLGHEVRTLGMRDQLAPLRQVVDEWNPHIAFNILEEFQGETAYDYLVVSYMESIGLAYTGCNPRGLIIARDKSLTKKILSYHRVRVPDFIVIPRRAKIRRPKRLDFPLIVKSLVEEASLGIAQASVVDSDEKLKDRVEFIHETIKTDALVEKFIDGRELYVAVLGHSRLTILPVWELTIENASPNAPLIATWRVKWDMAYQEKIGLSSHAARDLPAGIESKIQKTSKRVYHGLGLSGYARLDYRLSPEGDLYLLEANPNPQLAAREDFASAAKAGGLGYKALIQKVLNLGAQYRACRRAR